jgi:hypothetical protein
MVRNSIPVSQMQVSFLDRHGTMVHVLAMPMGRTMVMKRLEAFLNRWKVTMARDHLLDFMDSDLKNKLFSLLRCLDENKRLLEDDKRLRAQLYERFMDVLQAGGARDIPLENTWTPSDWEDQVKNKIKKDVQEFREGLE